MTRISSRQGCKAGGRQRRKRTAPGLVECNGGTKEEEEDATIALNVVFTAMNLNINQRNCGTHTSTDTSTALSLALFHWTDKRAVQVNR